MRHRRVLLQWTCGDAAGPSAEGDLAACRDRDSRRLRPAPIRATCRWRCRWCCSLSALNIKKADWKAGGTGARHRVGDAGGIVARRPFAIPIRV